MNENTNGRREDGLESSVTANRAAIDETELTTPDGRDGPRVTVLLRMRHNLVAHGRQRAIEGGVLEPDAADLDALEQHATAIAREVYRSAFDPGTNAHDGLRDSEYRKNLADRAEAEQAEKFATATVREREEELAQAQSAASRPEPSMALQVAAVVAIMLTTAPTLHDFIFLLSDDVFSWTLSLFGGLFLGTLITLMILGDVDATGRRSTTNQVGLIAGIFIGLALGGLRIKDATSGSDFIFAAALTVLEIGIVIGLEGIAISRRALLRQWAAARAIAEQAAARLDAARQNLKRCRERVAALNDTIRAHIAYVEERSVCNLHINEIEAAARQAVRDGYRDGIAQNRGRVLGIGEIRQ